jgi:peptidoglycan hydrolase-like protein with peptidoglycan-binding domain
MTTGSKKSSVTNGHSTSDQVKMLQQSLQDKGMDPGPIDGVMGPKTQAALRAYQKDQNLPQTGRTDPQTLEKLGVQR